MKTKFLKIGMPIMVFMLAIVFAFATPTQEERNNVQTLGYIQELNDCVQVANNCVLNASVVCTTGSGSTIFRSKFGTICQDQMYFP